MSRHSALRPTNAKLSVHRRSFIKAVGASLAALPFCRPIEDSFAQSAGEELPLKFIGVYHPHGISAEYFVMRDGDSETSFDLRFENSSLEPFDDAATYGKSFKDKLIAIEGIDLLSNANGHDSAATILTGSRIDGGKPQNSSLDQFLAVERGLGGDNRVTSIALGVGDADLMSGLSLSCGPGGEPLSKVIDPVEAFDILFKGVVVGDDPVAQAEAERQRRLGQSLIDFVRADVERLRGRLATEERQKLDQHLDSLRDIEKQFQSSASGGASCSVPQRPAAFQSLKRWNGGEPYFDAITDAHIDILAQALACDITRFATLFMADLAYAGNPLDLPADNHGSVAHTYAGSAIGTGRSEAGNPSTWLPLARFNRYSYGKIARLMMRLDQFGVLDSSLIYASSDMGDPALHSTRNVPSLIAGGANGRFRMGRRIRIANDCPASNGWCQESDPVNTTVSNNKILVAIAQAFGVQIDSFGTQPNPDNTTGALSELS
jgi:hypothetical protein